MTYTELDLDEIAGPIREKSRAPRPSKTKGAWRYMADGSPSSDGIHADIAGACRLMFGPPGLKNRDGIIWWSVEQRRAMGRGENFIAQARGCVGGTPEFYLWDGRQIWPGEVKRPQSISPKTGRKVQAEDLTTAQAVIHPHFAAAGLPIVVWRSRDEFIAWVRARGIAHRRISL